MKRADVKAGVLYAVNHGEPVMVVDEALWVEDWRRAGSTYRPARPGEKSTKSVPGYGHTTVGLPAMVRSSLMMPNPEYVGEEEYDRLYEESRKNGDRWTEFRKRCQTDTRLQDEIPDPLRWEWKPTVLEPKYALEPLDEYEAAVRAEQERDRLEREAMQRELDDRRARFAAIVDVLDMTNNQRISLMTRPTAYTRGHYAEVTLEWLEEVAGRLRQGSGCVEVH